MKRCYGEHSRSSEGTGDTYQGFSFMTQPMFISFARAIAVTLLLAFAIAAYGSSVAEAAGQDGPGSFYVFRTRDTTQPATAAQNANCKSYFGATRYSTVITRLNAALYSPTTDPATGRVTDQTAAPLGPGFICSAPGLNLDGILESYAYTALPGMGTVYANGPCSPEPVFPALGAIVASCRLKPRPDPAVGVTGGLITSNSIVNQTPELAPDTPTGSVWTAYVTGTPIPSTDPPTVVTPPGDEAPGINFFIARSVRAASSTSTRNCSAPALFARTSTLTSVQPDPATSRIPDADGPEIGKLLVCYSVPVIGAWVATAKATLRGAAGPVNFSMAGRCANVGTSAGNAQSCSFSVTSGVKGGMITSNGLADPVLPQNARNASIWTFALFGSQVAP